MVRLRAPRCDRNPPGPGCGVAGVAAAPHSRLRCKGGRPDNGANVRPGFDLLRPTAIRPLRLITAGDLAPSLGPLIPPPGVRRARRARPRPPRRDRRGAERARSHVHRLRRVARPPPRAARARRARRGRPGDRARPRRPVAAPRARRGRLRPRDRLPDPPLQERSRSLEPALLVVRRGQREYRSVFFTRQEAPIRSPRRPARPYARAPGAALDLGLRAAARRAGARGHHPGRRRRRGRRPGPVRYVLALAEVNQAVWVLHGKGDAGAFNEGDWAALPEKVRSQLRVFHEPRPIDRGLLAFRTGLAPARGGVEETSCARRGRGRAAPPSRAPRASPASSG